MNLTIAELPAAATLTGTELVPLWQGSGTVQAPLKTVKLLVGFLGYFASYADLNALYPAPTTPAGTIAYTADQGPVTNNGQRWVVPSSAAPLYAASYSLDPTGTFDNAASLNAATLAAITARVPLILPPGLFRINSPWFAYSGFATSIHISGQGGPAYPSSSYVPEYPLQISDAMTVIYANFGNQPAIIFSGNRQSSLKNIGLIGQNVAPGAGTPATWTQPVDNSSAYVSVGCRNAQYSPYCAIAIDPCITEAAPPDGGYPGLTYNQTNNDGSSGVLVENVSVQCFVVGVGIQTCGQNENGDDCKFRNVNIAYCDTAYACGSSQADLWRVEGGNIFGCRQGYDSLNYGGGQGQNPEIRDQNLGYLYRIFAGNSPFGDMSLWGCYAESLRSLGYYGIGSSVGRHKLIIKGGSYTLTAGSIGGGVTFAPLPPLVLETHGPTEIDTSFSYSGSLAANGLWSFNIGAEETIPVSIKGVVPGTTLTDIPPFVGITKDMANGGQVMVDELYVQSANGFTLWKDTPQSYGIGAFSSGGRYRAHPQAQTVSDLLSSGTVRYFFDMTGLVGQTYAVVNSVTALTIAGSQITFSTSTGNANWIQVGDIFLWQTVDQGASEQNYVAPMLQVASVNAGTGAVVCNMLFDPLSYDTVANWNTYNTGNMYLVPVRWAPAQQLTCTTSTSSNQITAVSPTGCLKNGDFVNGAGLPLNTTRVVSGGGTATVTLNITPSANASDVVLFFDRLMNPTVTAAY